MAGIDISGNLIRKAREIEQSEPLGIDYAQADVAAPGSLGGREFDLVASSFGLSDIGHLRLLAGHQAHDADRKPVYLAARSVKVIEN